MATIFPREEKAEALFGEIRKNPEACRRLRDTFNDSLDMASVLDAPEVNAQQFTAALFNAYENKDLAAFLMALCRAIGTPHRNGYQDRLRGVSSL